MICKQVVAGASVLHSEGPLSQGEYIPADGCEPVGPPVVVDVVVGEPVVVVVGEPVVVVVGEPVVDVVGEPVVDVVGEPVVDVVGEPVVPVVDVDGSVDAVVPLVEPGSVVPEAVSVIEVAEPEPLEAPPLASLSAVSAVSELPDVVAVAVVVAVVVAPAVVGKVPPNEVPPSSPPAAQPATLSHRLNVATPRPHTPRRAPGCVPVADDRARSDGTAVDGVYGMAVWGPGRAS
jgi:hypothetical protein